jgi:hypothetical protein
MSIQGRDDLVSSGTGRRLWGEAKCDYSIERYEVQAFTYPGGESL